jgi:N-acetylmuramoyl-L-alanine amidase/putative methionine-R-sulfoxide reductase with GAF domain
MVTTPTKPMEDSSAFAHLRTSVRPLEQTALASAGARERSPLQRELRPSGGDALQALLAFSAMHQQVRRRTALASRHKGFEVVSPTTEFEAQEQFVLDEVLQLVADRAVAITGADGLGIALAENSEIVLRASAGTVKPDVGARIQRDSAFSGACFRAAQIIRCDDTETDDRVNLYACRQLGARSMVAVPLCGRKRVIGLLEAFSAEPFGFNDSDVASLELLAELVVAALKPEDEDRFAEAAQVAEEKLLLPSIASLPATSAENVSASSVIAAEVTPQPKKTRLTNSNAGIVSVVDEKIDELAPPLTEQARVPQPAVPAFLTSAKAPSSSHHPGLILVLVLILAAGILGGGLWWKLRTAPEYDKLVASTTTTKSIPQSATSSNSSSSITPSLGVPSTSSNTGSGKPTAVDGGSLDRSTSAAGADDNAATEESGKTARITGIRHWSSADSSTVVLDLDDQVQYEAHRLSNPDRIYFDLHDTSLAPELEGKSIEIGDALLARARVAQPVSGLTRLVLETKGNSNYSVSLEPNPYRLVVEVTKIGATPKAQINLFPGTEDSAQKKLAIIVPPPTKEDLQLRAHVPKLRIVVDAGHGGWDLGTVGRRGLLEKDLVLEIAQRLGKLLESRLGASVILTRDDDNYIPLDERASMANQAQADLFISVHANYSDLPSARGVETYYTNFFSSPNAKDLETRSISGKSAATATLTATELHDKIEQSRRLAASVQRSLYGALSTQNSGLRDRGVKEASYVVLTETAMPGILAEVSFVSSPTDEQKLRSDGYREQIAEALYKGIARYAANSRAVKLASAAR